MTEIKLLTSQLLYDIRNIAYVEGHVLDDDTTARLHTRHLVTDIAEDGNIDIIARALHLAFASLQHLLPGRNALSLPGGGAPPLPGGGAPPRRHSDGCLSSGVPISLPKAFTLHLAPHSPSLVPLLARLAHRYMVASALCHWLSITHPDAAPKWRDAATDAETQLRSLTLSPSPSTRRPSPF